MESTVPVTLPGGYWLDGTCYREAELKPLSSADEAFVVEAGEGLLPAQRTTVLLTRSLTRLGPLSSVTSEAVASLTVGDREALLLQLRRLSLGESLQCVLTCPDPRCGEKMDLSVRVAELLLPPYPRASERHETTIGEKGDSYRVNFRLPTGFHQEEAAALVRGDPQAAADLLLRRCVEDVVAQDGQQVEGLPPVVVDGLPSVMAELDPQAEVELGLVCPVCRNSFSALLDAGTYFFRELQSKTKHLYGEVHIIALNYHWSEAEILALSHRKRRLYLGLLEDAFAEASAP